MRSTGVSRAFLAGDAAHLAGGQGMTPGFKTANLGWKPAQVVQG